MTDIETIREALKQAKMLMEEEYDLTGEFQGNIRTYKSFVTALFALNRVEKERTAFDFSLEIIRKGTEMALEIAELKRNLREAEANCLPELPEGWSAKALEIKSKYGEKIRIESSENPFSTIATLTESAIDAIENIGRTE